MGKVDELIVGPVLIEGKKYRRDVLILADGAVKKRKGGFRMFGSHEIKKQEWEELSQGQPEIVIVGTGTDGGAYIATEAAT